MQNLKTKWALCTATFTGILTAILLAAATTAITIKLLASTPATTSTSIPAWLESAANATPIAGIALSANAMAALTAILAAAHKFGLFRESTPHLSISQEVAFQTLSPGYTLVVVTAVLHNTSKVLSTPNYAICQLAQTSPLTDEDVEQIYDSSLNNPKDGIYQQFPWWQLGEVTKTWPESHITIEPAEKLQETFQFIIDDSVRSIVAITAVNLSKQVDDFGPVCYTFAEVP